VPRFLDSIERHLQRVQVIQSSRVIEPEVGPDFAAHESTLLAAHDRARTVDARRQRYLDEQFERTWSGRRLEHFVDEMHWTLLAGVEGQLDSAARARLIDSAVLSVSGLEALDADAPSGVRGVRLTNLVDQVQTEVDGWSSNHPWQIVSRYCERLDLVRTRHTPPRLRMRGQTWLRLRGIDRLRWLLALEFEQAVGDDDPWCVSPAQVAVIVRHAGRSYLVDDHDDGEDPFPLASSLDRWSSLGALTRWEREEPEYGTEFFGYELTTTGRQLWTRDAETQDLFANLAQAQARDDRAAVLRAPGDGQPGPELAATTMRHARLVAHEVRNALVPVSYALEKIWKAIDASDLGATMVEPRAEIEQGITRLYAFVETSARMSSPVEDLPASFAILEAIEAARTNLTQLSGSIRVETIPGTANPRCRGHRGRFVLALLNLLRNAVQVAGPQVALTITVDTSDRSTVELSIDDDGPGVPDVLHARIFQNGTSSRPDGTGHGLALVREVVERELGGTITHEASPGGGARFRLRLPAC
jgi:signal transduction histidine kinase